jgi:hypothetical protein
MFLNQNFTASASDVAGFLVTVIGTNSIREHFPELRRRN